MRNNGVVDFGMDRPQKKPGAIGFHLEGGALVDVEQLQNGVFYYDGPAAVDASEVSDHLVALGKTEGARMLRA